MRPEEYFAKYWAGEQSVTQLVEALSAAAKAQAAELQPTKGGYRPHLGSAAVELGLQGGTVVKVSS